MITERKYDDEMQSSLTPSLGGGTIGALGGSVGANPKGTSSGRFTNLQSYINKNRGTTNQTLNKVRNDSENYQKDLVTNVNKVNDANLGARDTYNNIRNNQNRLNRIADNPYDTNAANDYNSLLTQSAASRAPIANYESAQNDLRGLTERRNALNGINTSGGIRNYLSSIQGARPGSAGGMNLDEFLLTSTPESMNQLNTISDNSKFNPGTYNPADGELDPMYGEVSGFDPNTISSRIQTRLQGDLNLQDEGSVNRYNQAQRIYGGQLANYLQPKTPVKEADIYRGGIKDFVSSSNLPTPPPSFEQPPNDFINEAPLAPAQFGEDNYYLPPPPQEFNQSDLGDPTKDLAEGYNENKKINRFGFGGYTKGSA